MVTKPLKSPACGQRRSLPACAAWGFAKSRRGALLLRLAEPKLVEAWWAVTRTADLLGVNFIWARSIEKHPGARRAIFRLVVAHGLLPWRAGARLSPDLT